MNSKLRLLLIVLASLCVANIGWRWYASWGRITVSATDRPVKEVIRSLEKQAGIRIATNLPADATVTMHVRKVPLLHALEVFGANTGANWSLAYFAAPEKAAIDAALGTMASGEELAGWKRWSMPPMRGGPDAEEGSSDPRLEEWQTKPAKEGNLHSYLGQASNVLSAQFWAPEQWNPTVNAPPKSGKITNVLPKLAKNAHGKSVEVFLLRGQRRRQETADSGERERGGDRGDRGFRGPPSEEMRRAMEERVQAQIARLPDNKKAAALAQMDERRKFFAEMSSLTPEERRAKMEEFMEKMRNDPEAAARMSAGEAKRGAMQTADQRAERNRGYLDRKRQAE